MRLKFTIKELEPATWSGFESLISKQGGCWCMYYQRPHSRGQEMKQYNVAEKEMRGHNRRRKKELVEQGRAHGIIVYDGARPVGWCAYGLGEEFPRVDRGRFYHELGLKDARGRLWRIPCFYVDRDYRRKGVSAIGLRAALESIGKQGGGLVEAYPRVGKQGGAVNLWFGTVGMFEREGFQKVGPLGVSVLMRKAVQASERRMVK